MKLNCRAKKSTRMYYDITGRANIHISGRFSKLIDSHSQLCANIVRP